MHPDEKKEQEKQEQEQKATEQQAIKLLEKHCTNIPQLEDYKKTYETFKNETQLSLQSKKEIPPISRPLSLVVLAYENNIKLVFAIREK